MGRNFRRALVIVGAMVVAGYGLTALIGGSLLLDTTAVAQQPGSVPGDTLGSTSDSQLWRAVREGQAGQVSIPDANAGILIQSEGEAWRAIRNGPLSTYGIWALLGMIILVALFFAVRGRVRIEAGPSGRKIERFGGVERFSHWLTAGSFIVLALTGLNILYGRYALLPLLGPDLFATISLWGKLAHNYLAFAFMLGLVLCILLWVLHNFPNRYDLVWLAKGGGLFSKHSHPPSKKFNAGQKLIFWVVVLGGVSVSLTGIALMFPFEFAMFAPTFEVLNALGFQLPTDLSPIQEQQLSQLWHTIVALFMIVVIIAHIYIGTIGMEGAFDAMGSGMVDENWAREHHSVWVAEMTGEPVDKVTPEPKSDTAKGEDSAGDAPQRA